MLAAPQINTALALLPICHTLYFRTYDIHRQYIGTRRLNSERTMDVIFESKQH